MQQPQTTLLVFLASRNITWYSLFGACTLSGTCGPDLALGYLVTKVTTKFRQPVNLALAAVLTRLFPVLTEVQGKSLLGILSPTDIGVTANSRRDNDKTVFDIIHAKVELFINGPVNEYGFSLFVASRVTMLSSIIITSLCSRYGFDLYPLLLSIGINDAVQTTGGAMGAASIINTILLPVHLYLLPDYLVPQFLKYTKRSRLYFRYTKLQEYRKELRTKQQL
jgi:hypothetical protein